MQRCFASLVPRRMSLQRFSFLPCTTTRIIPFSVIRISQKTIHHNAACLNFHTSDSSSVSGPSISPPSPPISSESASHSSTILQEEETSPSHSRCRSVDHGDTLPTTTTTPSTVSAQEGDNNHTFFSSSSLPSSNATTVVRGPHRRVGNVFVVLCVDHPFKHSWEVNRMLRELRLEFMGQISIVPDIPLVRRQLWRVRHVVRVDMLDLDEAKAWIGVPEHITFSDLNAQITTTFGRGKAYSSPVIRSKAEFMKIRRARLRDVLHRDQLEKELLEEKRRALFLAARNNKEKTKNI